MAKQPKTTSEHLISIYGYITGLRREVGQIKTAIREAILDGDIDNDKEEAIAFMVKVGEDLGLKAK